MKKNAQKLTRFFSWAAHKLPAIKIGNSTLEFGELYDNHYRFFNDGLVELICLIVASTFVWTFSHLGFVETPLVLINLAIATPITFATKYLSHKFWVWREE